jgi:DNA polymerase I-like protein with 3'-5' exonuclease and polymerase domains
VYHILQNINEHADLIDYDTETTGLDVLNDIIICYQIAWSPNDAIVIPIYHTMPDIDGVKQFISTEETPLEPYWKPIEQGCIEALLKDILGSEKIKKVAQNAKFDGVISRKNLGINYIPIYYDTKYGEKLLDESLNRKQTGLNTLTLKYTNLGEYWKELQDLKKGDKNFNYARFPEEVLFKYGGYDVISGFRVYLEQKKLLKAQGLWELATKIACPYINIVEELKINGFKIDLEKQKELDIKYSKLVEQAKNNFLSLKEIGETEILLTRLAQEKKRISKEKNWYKKEKKKLSLEDYLIKYNTPVDKVVFNAGSPAQVNKLIFDVCKLPRNRSNSTCEKELLKLKGKHKVIDYLLYSRKINKFYSTDIKPIPSFVKEDGRIHADFQEFGAETGRLSCKNPNLQNKPKKDKEKAHDIKSMYVASDGCFLLSADVKQSEVRFFAEESKDKKLIADLKNPKFDIHTLTASRIFALPPEKITSTLRTLAKTAVFGGIIYGGGAYVISRDCGISEEKAQGIINDFFRAYPESKQWINSYIKDAINNGYAVGYFGRRRRFKDIQELYEDFNMADDSRRRHIESQIINNPIQGASHDFLKIIGNRIYKIIRSKNLKSKFVNDVHDNLIFDCPKDELKLMCKIVKYCFEKPVGNMVVPMSVDIEIGKRWSDLKKVKV